MSENLTILEPSFIQQARYHLARVPASQLHLHQEVAKRLIAHFEGVHVTPQVVLNLGAAASCLTPLLQQAFPQARIISFDLTSVLPKNKWYQRKTTYPVPISGDPFALPFPEKSIDLVISNLAIYWWEPRQQLFAEVQRVLKPNGGFFFSTLGPDSLQQLRNESSIQTYRHFSDLHDVGDDLVQAGFQHPVMDMEYLTYSYNTAALLQQDMERWQLQPWYLPFTAPETEFPSVKTPQDLTFELIYGHAWCSRQGINKATNQESRISVSNITTRKNI
jgi:malonyl-CoA O-methyltransferase